MKKPKAMPEKENHDHKIREKAEAKLANMPSSQEMAGKKTDELIHELQVHQIELEMQNEELKKTQMDLEKTKEKYIDLYDFAPIGYFTFSREGLIKEVNLTGAGLLGITRKKLIDRGFGNFVVPSDFNLWNDHLLLSIMSKDQEKQSCELRLKREDGSKIFVRLESVRIEIMDVTLQVRTAVSDFTERKTAENLRIENLRLETADKAKSELLANMSHELRTPLNASIGFSELLKQGMAGELSEKQRKYVDNILTSNQFLLTLINDILDISKIEAGKIELVIDRMSVPETIQETLSLIKEKAMKHNVLLKTEFDPELEFIEADKQRVKQILFNLINNAVKFSKEEGGTVTIITKKEGAMAKVSVSDTGIGIKEENGGKLFQKFEQLESGISQKYGGTGLGLAITKQLVEQHGGKIWAESKYGEGTTFTFTLPIVAKKMGDTK
ncbi:MAG: PAS domain-containing sensor histidine kinase [Candidatus Methanoperedens sp.]